MSGTPKSYKENTFMINKKMFVYFVCNGSFYAVFVAVDLCWQFSGGCV